MKISVVFPCYNPPAGWAQALYSKTRLLLSEMREYDFNFVVSNDGSVRMLEADVSFLKSCPDFLFLDHAMNEGKGAAVRKAMPFVLGDFVIYTDIDMPFGVDSIRSTIHVLETSADCGFVYGLRDRAYFKSLPLRRRVVSSLLRTFIRLYFLGKVGDTQAGIKGFRKELMPLILETRTNSFIFEVELIRRLMNRKVKLASVPVRVEGAYAFSDFRWRVLVMELKNMVKILAA